MNAAAEIIVRRVKVNRTRTSLEAIKATGRKMELTDAAVEEMPRGEGEDVEVHFFSLNYKPTSDDLKCEMERRDLKPDPIALMAVIEEDPSFADKHWCVTEWRDSSAHYCYALFWRWQDSGRHMVVHRYNSSTKWTYKKCLFAGVKK